MKNIFKLTLVGLLLLFITSCEDNEKSPLPAPADGSFVTIVFDNLIMDVTDLENTAVSGTLRAPVANVASYDLQVRRTNAVTGESSEFVDVYTTDTFPADFNISLPQIADALDIDLDDLNAGDRFDFVATSTSDEGIVTNFSSLNGDLQAEPGQLQSYTFTSYISCPVDVSLIEGTYLVTDLGFNGFFNEPALGTATRTVIAGPGANQLTIVEGEYPATGMSDPLIIEFDPATGIVTGGGNDEDGDPAVAFAEGVNGLPQNTYIVRDGGFFFSCIGLIDLRMNFDPFTANPHNFVLVKQQ